MLADEAFMGTLATYEAKVLELKIEDAASAQAAADLQRLVTDAGSALEAERIKLLAPFLAFQRSINATAKGPQGRIDVVKARLRAALGSWDQKERDRAAQIERDRQAEIRRLQVQKDEEERQARHRAQKILDAQRAREEAARAPAVIPGGPAPRVLGVTLPPAPAPRVLGIAPAPLPAAPKTETQIALERLTHAPAPVVAAKPSGVRFITRLKFEVIDIAVLPEPFVTRIPNDKAIRDMYVKGYKDGDPVPECPGIKFITERTAEST
jgi:hypothetical protein